MRCHRLAAAVVAPQRREQTMRNPVVAWIALIILVTAASGPLAAADKRNFIKILEATYGGNCEGVAKGNATHFVAAACDNKNLCNYRVYYKTIGGDPATGCDKTFAVAYTCGRSTKRNICELQAEAGKGGEDGRPNEFCLLHCLSTGQRFDPERDRTGNVSPRDRPPG
jgi:hypothetical protein